jgi:hypothetical protein
MATKRNTPPATQFKPFKYVLQAILLEVDGTGAVLGERPTEPVVVYGVDRVVEWANTFADELAKAQPQ